MKRVLPAALAVISLLSVTIFFVEQSQVIHATSKTTLMLYEHDTTTKFFGDKKKLNGGYETYTNPVYDVSDKIRIGSSDGMCMYVSQSTYQCDWTIALPAGKIVISGADILQDSTEIYAVVGGTGLYSGTKGEAVLNFLHMKKGDEYKYTFNLV